MLIHVFTEERAPISEETEVKDEPLHHFSEYDEVGEINCQAVNPWHSVKTENEGKTLEVGCYSAFLDFFCQN